MYDHHIKDMARSLVEAGLATDQKQVELVLQKYWEDKVAIVWTTDYVRAILNNFNEDEQTSFLSEEQAQSILQRALGKHNAKQSITWESLRFWSEELGEEVRRDE